MLKIIIILLIFAVPAFFPIKNLLAEGIPHWFDSSRILLLGLENHEKIRLIGHESGIPGVFYGPHWSWMLSVVQIFNKNPAVIAFVVLFLPYFAIIPLVLYKFKYIFGLALTISLWLLFILEYQTNILNLWHINLTPVLFLALIYCLVTVNFEKLTRLEMAKIFIAGFLTSFVMNIHGLFGYVVLISSSFYFIGSAIYFYLQSRKKLARLLLPLSIFALGFLLSHSPFILFELRHGFIQTKAILNLLTLAIIYKTGIVGQVGLSNSLIIQEFLNIPLTLMQIPQRFMPAWWIVALISFVYIIFKKKLDLLEKRLLLFLIFSSGVLLVLFLISKNPIWSYHFIGVEILLLLFIGFLARKIKPLGMMLMAWVVVLMIWMVWRIVTDKPNNPLTMDTLASKKFTVESIYQDAKGEQFGAFAYSSAIYTFDWDYLFKWLGKDKYGYIPSTELQETVYLIIPSKDEGIKIDFINYKTPGNQFTTEKEWLIPNGTWVVKRVRI